MKITGYRTLTEKEHDYLTIHRLLQKYGISTLEINKFLKGGLSTNSIYSNDSVEFCAVNNNLSVHTIFLGQLPEGTTELLIETKCTTKC